MDVATLVKQMHENLTGIHSTIAGLSTDEHDARLDELEQKRDSLLDSLHEHFQKKAVELESKRQDETAEVKERRRIEDEEREARRRKEDEEYQSKASAEDAERKQKLDGDIKNLDDETEQQMDAVEEEARKLIEDGKERLRDLEEKRREINRLIDEQLKMPLPSLASRNRVRGEKSSNRAPNGATTSMPIPPEVEERSLDNNDKAPEAETIAAPESGESAPDGTKQRSERDSDSIESRDITVDNINSGSNHDEAEQARHDLGEPAEKSDTSEGSPEGYTADLEEEPHKYSQTVDSAKLPDTAVQVPKIDSRPSSPSEHRLNHNEEETGTGDDTSDSMGAPNAVSKSTQEAPESPASTSDRTTEISQNSQSEVSNAAHDLSALTETIPDSTATMDVQKPLDSHDQPEEIREEPSTPSRTQNVDEQIRNPNVSTSHPDSKDDVSDFEAPGPQPSSTPAHDDAHSENANIRPDSDMQSHVQASPAESHVKVNGASSAVMPSAPEVGEETSVPFREQHHESTNTSNPEDQENSVIRDVSGQDQSDQVVHLAENQSGHTSVDRNLDAETETSGGSSEIDNSSAVTPPAVDGGMGVHGLEPSSGLGEVTGIPNSAQQNPEDEQVRNSNKTHHVLDESLPPNGTLDMQLERGPASEPEERPPPLQEQHTGDHSEQDHGVAFQPETDSHSTQGHGPVGGSDLADEAVTITDSDGADEKPQNKGALTLIGSAVGSITATIAHALPSITSSDSAQGINVEDGSESHAPNVNETHTRPPTPTNALKPTANPESSESTASGSDETDVNRLTVDAPLRQSTRSPLPVENDTVHGHEDLFDDDSASSYREEAEAEDVTLHKHDEPTIGRFAGTSSEGADDSRHDDTAMEEVVEHPNDDDDGAQTTVPSGENPKVTKGQHDSRSDLDESRKDRMSESHGDVLSPVQVGTNDLSEHSTESTNFNGAETPVREESENIVDPETRGGSKSPSHIPASHPNGSETSLPALGHASPTAPNRGGLAASRHAPWNSPQAPSRPAGPKSEAEPDFDPGAFMPRDVTDVPWHARRDSTPQSMHSQSTLSSAPSSPVLSSFPADKHEPVIRDSWPVSVGRDMRSRANTQFTDRTESEYIDPFKDDSAEVHSYDMGPPSQSTEMHETQPQPEPQSNRNSLAGSPMFQKIRSMFEGPNGGGGGSGGGGSNSEESSPTRSRPVSSIFHSVSRGRSSSLRKSANLSDSDDSPRRGGFLNEHEDETDEQSALLHSYSGDADRN